MTSEAAGPRADDTPAPAPPPERGAAPVIRSAGIALIGSALGGLLVIGNEMVAASYLDVTTYGLYASGMTLARLCEALAIFGLPVTLFHFIPAWRQDGERTRIVGAVRMIAALPLLVGLLLGTLLWLAAPVIGPQLFRSTEVVPYLRMLGAAVPFMALSEVLGAATRAFGHAWYYVLVRNLVPPVVFLAALSLIRLVDAAPLAVPASLGLAYLLACLTGAGVVAFVAGPDLWRLRAPWPFRTVLGYASGVMANSSLYIVFALTGILSVGAFHGSDQVGVYRVCLQLVVPFEMVILAFHAAMGPVYPLLLRGQDRKALEDAYVLALRGMVVLTLPLGIALAWNAPEILGLAGVGFVQGAATLRTLALGFAVFTCFGTVAYLLMLGGMRHHETRNAAWTAAVNVGLCLLLVPPLGTLGAAAATMGGFGLLNLIRMRQARKLLGLATLRPDFVRIAVVSALAPVASLGLLMLGGIVQGPSLWALLGRLMVMSLVQVAALWTLGLSASDKATVTAHLRRLRDARQAARGGTPPAGR